MCCVSFFYSIVYSGDSRLNVIVVVVVVVGRFLTLSLSQLFKTLAI